MAFPSNPSRRDFLATAAIVGASCVGRPGDVLALATGRADPTRLEPSARTVEHAVRVALAHVLHDGLDDVFSRPFELDDLAASLDGRERTVNRVLEIVRGGAAAVSRLERPAFVGVPKPSTRETRAVARLAPEEGVAYLALSLLAAPRLEALRIPKERNVVFSHRFALDPDHPGTLFDPDFSYSAFRIETGRWRSRSEVGAVGHADVRLFYDSVKHDRLSHRLLESDVEPGVVEVLAAMLGRFEKRPGHGLPVGSNASRILADSILRPIDGALTSEGIRFVRFVDDYRIFAESPPAVEGHLDRLAVLLAEEGLSMHPGKREVRPSSPPPEGRRVAQAATPEKEDEDRRKPPRRGAAVDADGYESPEKPIGPDSRELQGLQRVPMAAVLRDLKADSKAPRWLVRRYVRAAVFCPHPDHVRRLPELVSRWPEHSRLVVGHLSVAAGGLAKAVRDDVRDTFAAALTAGRLPNRYVVAQILRLLGSNEYRHEAAVERVLAVALRERDDFLTRATLDASWELGSARVPRRVTWPGPWSQRAAGRLRRARTPDHA